MRWSRHVTYVEGNMKCFQNFSWEHRQMKTFRRLGAERTLLTWQRIGLMVEFSNDGNESLVPLVEIS